MVGNNDATVYGNVERARGVNGELDGSYQFAGWAKFTNALNVFIQKWMILHEKGW